MELTVAMLDSLPPGAIIAKGLVLNSPGGVYMTDQNKGREMMWIAKRGTIHDWAIYIHWATSTERFVLEHGDKLLTEKYIRKLVPCTDEAFKLYRK